MSNYNILVAQDAAIQYSAHDMHTNIQLTCLFEEHKSLTTSNPLPIDFSNICQSLKFDYFRRDHHTVATCLADRSAHCRLDRYTPCRYSVHTGTMHLCEHRTCSFCQPIKSRANGYYMQIYHWGNRRVEVLVLIGTAVQFISLSLNYLSLIPQPLVKQKIDEQ